MTLKLIRIHNHPPWQDWGWECTIEARMQELSSSAIANKSKDYTRVSDAQLRKTVAMEAQYQLEKARFSQ